MNKFYYVCWTTKYPDADEVERGVLPTDINAVCKSMDEAFAFCLEEISSIIYPRGELTLNDIMYDHVTIRWNVSNDFFRLTPDIGHYIWAITKVERPFD